MELFDFKNKLSKICGKNLKNVDLVKELSEVIKDMEVWEKEHFGIWSIEDVIACSIQKLYFLTYEQYLDIVEFINGSWDSDYGISWDNISSFIEDYAYENDISPLENLYDNETENYVEYYDLDLSYPLADEFFRRILKREKVDISELLKKHNFCIKEKIDAIKDDTIIYFRYSGKDDFALRLLTGKKVNLERLIRDSFLIIGDNAPSVYFSDLEEKFGFKIKTEEDFISLIKCETYGELKNKILEIKNAELQKD